MCPITMDKDIVVDVSADVADDEEMEVEVITISDDEEVVDDDEYDMYDPVYDREVNIFLDDIEEVDFEPDIIDQEEEEAAAAEEHQPLIDDGYASDTGVIESSREMTLYNDDIISLNENTRVCVVFSYVAPWGSIKLCSPCFMRNRERFAIISVIERHETMRYRDVPHHHCIDCQERVFVIFLANMCPVCQSRKYL